MSKSPGPDLITTKHFKCCADVLNEPIFKKGDQYNDGIYRSISLTSVVANIMES